MGRKLAVTPHTLPPPPPPPPPPPHPRKIRVNPATLRPGQRMLAQDESRPDGEINSASAADAIMYKSSNRKQALFLAVIRTQLRRAARPRNCNRSPSMSTSPSPVCHASARLTVLHGL